MRQAVQFVGGGNVAFFFRFRRFPVAERFVGVRRFVLSENVGVAVHEFAAQRAEHVRKLELAEPAPHVAVKHRLQKHVAYFFGHGVYVAAVDCVNGFVGFFY